jgi:AraC family transcriptional activator of tynA and feaB
MRQIRAGEPTASGYFELSTDQVATQYRPEFWRETVLNRSDVDFLPDAAVSGFSASIWGTIGGGAELRYGRLAAGTLHRRAERCRRDGGDEILLSAIVSTNDQVRYRDSSSAFAVPAGRFLITDMSVPFALEMGRFRSINFRLPRAAVVRAVGTWPARLRGRLLPATPLTSLLFEQMVRFADAMPGMDDAARQVALDVTADFALGVLRLETRSAAWEEGAHSCALWPAAKRFVERNLDRADLGPAVLARALKCSRSQLYRLFASHDTAVMDHIRDRRLARCREMLSDPSCRLPVAEIASLCGMDNPSAFSRAFRQRYGCSPGEMRRQLLG